MSNSKLFAWVQQKEVRFGFIFSLFALFAGGLNALGAPLERPDEIINRLNFIMMSVFGSFVFGFLGVKLLQIVMASLLWFDRIWRRVVEFGAVCATGLGIWFYMVLPWSGLPSMWLLVPSMIFCLSVCSFIVWNRGSRAGNSVSERQPSFAATLPMPVVGLGIAAQVFVMTARGVWEAWVLGYWLLWVVFVGIPLSIIAGVGQVLIVKSIRKLFRKFRWRLDFEATLSTLLGAAFASAVLAFALPNRSVLIFGILFLISTMLTVGTWLTLFKLSLKSQI